MLLRIFTYDKRELRIFDLKEEDAPVQISEFDYVYFELISTKLNEDDMLIVRLGDFYLQLQPEIIEEDQRIRFCLGDDVDYFFPLVKTQYVEQEYKGRTIRLKRIFVNQIPTQIPLVVIHDKSFREFSGFIVKTHKVDDPDLKLMIQELMHRGLFHAENRSLSKIDVSGKQHIEGVRVNRLEKFKRKLADVKLKLPLFQQFPITTLKPEETYSSRLSDASNRSVEWLVENTHQLNKVTPYTRADEKFKLQHNAFSIDEILTEKLVNSTDTEENRIIHGFLEVLNHHFSSSIDQLKEEKENTKLNFLSQQIVNSIKEQEIQDLRSLIVQVNEIRTILHMLIPVNHKVYHFPEYSNRFLQSSHYQSVFDLMVYFHNHIDQNEEEETSSIGVQSVDRLFELFCFCRICESIARQSSDKQVKFEKQSNHGLLNMNESNPHAGEYQLIHEDGKSLVSVYYEALPKDFCYGRTMYPGSRKNRYLPDFVVKVAGNPHPKYIIVDAKYKLYSKKSLMDIDFKDLIFKYLMGIRIADRPDANIDGLMVMSYKKGIQRSQFTSFFDREYEMNNKGYIPIVGALDVSVNDKSNDALAEVIQRMIS